jgi:hypothetical protein
VRAECPVKRGCGGLKVCEEGNSAGEGGEFTRGNGVEAGVIKGTRYKVSNGFEERRSDKKAYDVRA